MSGSHVFYSFRFLQFLNLPTRRGQYLLMSGFGVLYSLCIMFTFTCISSFFLTEYIPNQKFHVTQALTIGWGGGQAGGGHRKRLRASLERNTSTVNLKIIRDVMYMYRYLLSAVSFIISNDQL